MSTTSGYLGQAESISTSTKPLNLLRFPASMLYTTLDFKFTKNIIRATEKLLNKLTVNENK